MAASPKTKPTKPKTYRLDIFELLTAANRHDLTYLERQPLDAQKGFMGRVALRWLSATSGANAELQLRLTNAAVNTNFDALVDYPDLQYRLMAMTGMGKSQRHVWIPLPKNGKSPAKIQAFLLKSYTTASVDEIDMILSRHTLETFTDLVNESSCTAQEAKELIETYRKAFLA